MIESRTLVPGDAAGVVLVLAEPLSFWGGLEPTTGEIIDRRHPQCGQRVTARILVLPAGRGSSSSSTVLAEAIRLRTAPAAIILAEPDPIIVMGALVARELYRISLPVVHVSFKDYAALRSGDTVALRDGVVDREP